MSKVAKLENTLLPLSLPQIPQIEQIEQIPQIEQIKQITIGYADTSDYTD